MNSFFSSGKFKVLLAIAVFLMGMMAYAGANERLTAAPQELLSLVVTPIQWVASSVSNSWNETIHKYRNYDEIVTENEALKAENAALLDKMVEYDRMVAENAAYEKLAGLQESEPNMSFVQAAVIGRDSLDAFGSFTVNKGTAAGVERGDTVISENGCLIGTVLEADLTACKVLTVLHPSFSVAAMVSRTRDNGIASGDSNIAQDGVLVLSNLARDTLANEGDEIITTGLGGVYPPDIRVGTIRSIEPELSGKSSYAVIAPGVDIYAVKQVFVITDF